MSMIFISLVSCSDDNDEPTSNSIVGTWFCSDNDEGNYFDDYTLIFKKDFTGSIRNDFGSRASSSEEMNFDWSLTLTSNGEYRLSVIYKSGDRYMDGPFGGGYAQWNRTVTIAGNTLSISMGDDTVMLFHRK